MTTARPKKTDPAVYVRAMDRNTGKCRCFTVYDITPTRFERLVRRAITEASAKKQTQDAATNQTS